MNARKTLLALLFALLSIGGAGTIHADTITPVSLPKTTKKVPKHKQLKKKRIANRSKFKTLKNMNFEELKTTKDGHLEKGDKETAIKYVEQMIKMCEDIKLIGDLMVELADLMFDTSKLREAEAIYGEFARLYPGSDHIEYALYKAILCSHYATLEYDRDQSKTLSTIEIADKFLERADLFTKYADEVKKIRAQCYEKVAESEISICKFYIDRGKLLSAKQRLKTIEKDILPHIPAIETRLIALQAEIELTETGKVGTETKTKQKQAEKTTVVAQKKKRKAAERF